MTRRAVAKKRKTAVKPRPRPVLTVTDLKDIKRIVGDAVREGIESAIRTEQERD